MAVLAVLGSQIGWAQMPQPSQPWVSAAFTKFFGDVTAFSSTAEMRLKSKSGADAITMTMDFALLDGKVRTETDLGLMKSKDMPAEAGAMMKQMGMDKMVNIVRPDRKAMYLIYPGLRAYTEKPLPKAEVEASQSKAKVEKEKLGKETVDGHLCEKMKVVLTGDDGKKQEALVWQATDLKDFPIQMEMSEGESTMVMLHRDVKLAKPEAQLFEAPADFAKHASMEAMMQGAMMKMMGGAK